jgi:hypothetical protein
LTLERLPEIVASHTVTKNKNMRTKSLLAAAAIIAASAASLVAQNNVYSLNVVGYVNKSFPAFQFVMVNNPLSNTNSDLNTLIPNAPDGSAVFKWNVGNQDLDGTVPTFVTGSGWVPNGTIAPGEGFFVASGGDFTNTFVGEVRQGGLTNVLVGNFAFEATGSQVPIGGNITNIMVGYPAEDGDSVFRWNVGIQDLDPTVSTYVVGSGWTPEVNIEAGDGFFISRVAGPVSWVRNFTVQ